MRIVILTQGSRGDFQPYIALGAALQQAGHEVIVPAPEVFQTLIREAGLTYRKTHSVSPQEFIRQPKIQAAMRSRNQLQVVTTLLREAGPMMEEIFDSCWESCHDAEAIIAGTIPWGAFDCAEKLGIPSIWATLHPLQSTRAFPSTFLSSFGVKFNARRNRLSYRIMRQTFWQMFRGPLNKWRKKRLGLAPLPFFGPYERFNARQTPTIYAISRHVLPTPTDWPAWHQMTGYWFLDEPPGWQPPADLLRFLEAGSAPVYIGFGSMDDQNPERMTSIALEALRLSGQRGVLLSGWGGIGQTDLPDTVYQAESLPHSWLFPRVAAVVHHGGAGTTAAGLRAGIPSIITPVAGDQPFWASCVKQLGVGVNPGSFFKITAEKLAAAITYVVTDPGIRDRARTVGEAVRAEQGLSRAVEIIQNYLAQKR
jgi:UDP:flavonoid glycosyltransferase YjiC (YdhE family)